MSSSFQSRFDSADQDRSVMNFVGYDYRKERPQDPADEFAEDVGADDPVVDGHDADA